ncbi:MAG: hypothetical protein H0T75_18865 [Rhizobiales bacterium]|nr:hypothetical protein [Hyphomicrobiales bacterium]
MSFEQFWARLDTGSQLAMRRLGLRLASIIALAALSPGAFIAVLQTFLFLSAGLCGALALMMREQFRGRSLNHWDESVTLFGCWALIA